MICYGNVSAESGNIDTAKIDSASTQLLAAGAVGFSMALMDGDGITWSASHGFADLETKRPMSVDTIMNVASISKTVTGTSLMMLVEQGKLDLDRDVNDYLPFEVRNPNHLSVAVTARQLLTHSSAIVDRYELYGSEIVYFPGSDNPISLGEFVQEYLSPTGRYFKPENFATYPPGSTKQYSNIGYGLAAYLVELLSGDPLNRFSANRIFKPLGMDSTGWMLTEIDTDQHSKLYKWGEEGNTLIEWYGLATWPDGGMRTSVQDLSRFFAAMINGGTLDDERFISGETVEAMFRPQFVTGQVLGGVADAENHQQAITWSYRTGEKGLTVVGHSGGDPGVRTHAYFYQETGRGAILLVNTSSDSDTFSQAVTDMIQTLLGAATEESL